jgi:hypothetical protein
VTDENTLCVKCGWVGPSDALYCATCSEPLRSETAESITALGTATQEPVEQTVGPETEEPAVVPAPAQETPPMPYQAAAEEVAPAPQRVPQRPFRETMPGAGAPGEPWSQSVATRQAASSPAPLGPSAEVRREKVAQLIFDPVPRGEVTRSAWSNPLHSRRRVVVAGVAVGAAVLLLGGAVWGASSWIAAGSAEAVSSPASTTVSSHNVVLPGWSSSAVWSAAGISAAVVRADGKTVLSLSEQTLTVRATESGEVVATQPLTGSTGGVLAVTVDGHPALVGYSDTEAFVWAEGSDAGVRIDLAGGRGLLVRGGTLFTHGADGSYSLITGAGSLPLTPPRAGTIPLGRAGEAVVWGSGRGTVIVAAVNGAVVTEATLAAPAAGASISDWVFKTGSSGPGSTVSAATDAVTVVLWTTPDGSQVGAAHNTRSGEVTSTFPISATTALVPPSGTELISGSSRIDLETGVVSEMPAGFVPSRSIGPDLYGATSDGAPAVLHDGDVSVVDAPTVTPIGAAPAGNLLTLTGGDLVAFGPTKSSRPDPDEKNPSTSLTK